MGLYTRRDLLWHVADEVHIGYITLGLILFPPHPAHEPGQVVFRALGMDDPGRLRITSPFKPSLREDQNVVCWVVCFGQEMHRDRNAGTHSVATRMHKWSMLTEPLAQVLMNANPKS